MIYLPYLFSDTASSLLTLINQEQYQLKVKGSEIRILNEPLQGSSLFLVETGEGRTPRPEEAVQDILQV